ncbi:MAG: M15 family metallopeptidase [Candidatus Latescibacterota bacterium]
MGEFALPFRMITGVSLLCFFLLPGSIASAQPKATPADLDARAAAIEQTFIEHGLADAGLFSPLIRVELKYAAPDNFMGESVYGNLTRCWLRREAAIKLAKAAGILRTRNPEYRLVVLDGARPRSVQRRMWALVRGTPRQPYVANPAGASMHNYGLAVDITVADGGGNRLDMGTPPDFFGALAQPRLEGQFLKEGKLTAAQIANRHLLREVMTAAGFFPLAIEWWHFDAIDKGEAKRKYQVIE